MIRVLIVDEVRLMGDAIASVLDDQPDIQVTGYASSVTQAVNHAKQCDVVVVNTNLPGDGAYRLTRALSSWGDRTSADDNPRVLVLGLTDAEAAVVRWVEAGAQGYVRKDASLDDLLKNVRSAYRGEAHVSPEIAGALMRRVAEFASWFNDIDAGPGELASLTPREMEVLKLLGCNFTNQEIADHLVVEVGTVKNHVHNILTKLEVDNRQEAAMHLLANRDQNQFESLKHDLGPQPRTVMA